MIKKLSILITLLLPLCLYAQTSPCPQPNDFPANEAEVMQFNGEAITSVFSFEFSSIEKHLKTIQTCFSEDGWDSYKNALKDSETIENIQKLKLTAKAAIESQSAKKDENNLWMVTSYLTIDYQNDTHFAKQKLKVDTLISDADKELKLLQVTAKEVSIDDNQEQATEASIEPTKAPSESQATQTIEQKKTEANPAPSTESDNDSEPVSSATLKDILG